MLSFIEIYTFIYIYIVNVQFYEEIKDIRHVNQYSLSHALHGTENK